MNSDHRASSQLQIKSSDTFSTLRAKAQSFLEKERALQSMVSGFSFAEEEKEKIF
jgi:hypothetical protein